MYIVPVVHCIQLGQWLPQCLWKKNDMLKHAGTKSQQTTTKREQCTLSMRCIVYSFSTLIRQTVLETDMTRGFMYDFPWNVGNFKLCEIIHMSITTRLFKVSFLFSDGQLWSKGDDIYSQLGRRTRDVGSTTFGRVPIAEPVRAIACEAGHCLALTENKVRYARLVVGATLRILCLRLDDYKGGYQSCKTSLQHATHFIKVTHSVILW